MEAYGFSNVKCYYTGGGIWLYSAKYHDTWLYGDLDDTQLGAYSIQGEEIEEKHDCLYDAYACGFGDYPTPTWGDIVLSLICHLREDPNLDEMVKTIIDWHQDIQEKAIITEVNSNGND